METTVKLVKMSVVMAVVAATSLLGGGINTSTPGWISFNQAEASPYRRSVRRTSRRTSRRTAYRHSGGHGHYYGGAAVVGAVAVTAIAVGTMVAVLPPACDQIVVNGVVYQNCSGTYYQPRGTQYIVVQEPY